MIIWLKLLTSSGHLSMNYESFLFLLKMRSRWSAGHMSCVSKTRSKRYSLWAVCSFFTLSPLPPSHSITLYNELRTLSSELDFLPSVSNSSSNKCAAIHILKTCLWTSYATNLFNTWCNCSLWFKIDESLILIKLNNDLINILLKWMKLLDTIKYFFLQSKKNFWILFQNLSEIF